jgi:hypothetical protein
MQARLKNYWRGKLSDHVAASWMDESTVTTFTFDTLFSRPNINPSIHPVSGFSLLVLLSPLLFFCRVLFSLKLRCCGRQWRWRNPSELINLEASVSRSVLLSWTNGFYPWKSSDEECCRPGLSLVIPFDSFIRSFFLCCLTPPHENQKPVRMWPLEADISSAMWLECNWYSLRECRYFFTAGSE